MEPLEGAESPPVWNAWEDVLKEMERRTSLLIAPRLGQLEKELGKGVEKKVAQGLDLIWGLQRGMTGIPHTVDSLTKAADTNASQIATLSRTVEQLSSQLIGEAKRNRQQQELLEKIWEKANSTPPQNVAPEVPRSGAAPQASPHSRVEGGQHVCSGP